MHAKSLPMLAGSSEYRNSVGHGLVSLQSPDKQNSS